MGNTPTIPLSELEGLEGRLLCDVWPLAHKGKKPHGAKGDKVEVIRYSYPVWMVRGKDGNRFTVDKDEIIF